MQHRKYCREEERQQETLSKKGNFGEEEKIFETFSSFFSYSTKPIQVDETCTYVQQQLLKLIYIRDVSFQTCAN